MKSFRKILFAFILSFALVFSAGAVVFSQFDNQTAFAAANGGSVYVGNNSTYILEGRKSICGFDATNGGGVYVGSGGTFKMTGGDIFANKASMGGGVYVFPGGTFNLSGGSISQNQATDKNVDGITHGGGVYSAGTFNMSGGSIVENIGNGISIGYGVTTISGGTIAGNGENAIYISNGSLMINGGTIVGNIDGNSSSVSISGGEIRGNVVAKTISGGTIYGTVKTDVALSIYDGSTILSNGTYAVLSSSGDITINKAKIVGDVKAESGNIHINKNSDITGKIIISNSSKTIYLDDWTADFVPTYTLDFSSLTSVDETKAYFVFANSMGTQADTSKMTIVAPDGYKAVSKMVNGTNGIYFEVDKVDFPSNWKTQINSSTYMSTTVTPASITSLRFVSAVPSGFNEIGTFTTGLKVYKNANDIAFVGGNIMAPANSSNLFSQMSNLTTIDFSNFKTGNVTSMSYMFWLCPSLTSLDLSGFNTANVTNMFRMFESCSKLTSIDVGGFDTSKVTNMFRMFFSCSALTSLDVSGFNTSKVTDMSYMFWYCSSLTSLDLRNFDTSKVTDMSYMFDGCKALTSLNISSFNMSKVTNFESMFDFGSPSAIKTIKTPYNNSQEIEIGGFVFDVEETGGVASSILANSSRSYTYTISKYLPNDWQTQVASSTYMTTTITPANLTSIKFVSSVPSGYTKIGTLSTGLPVYKGATATDIAFVSSKKISAPVYSNDLFFGLREITSFDFSNFDTSVVKNMNSMFQNCNKLTNLDISKFNTAKVTNMSRMFSSCYLLSSITFGDNFSFNEVTDMSYMFGNTALTTINLSPYLNSSTNYKFFTMESMFSFCEALTTVNLGTFNAPLLDSVYEMFYNCDNLSSINMEILKTNYLRTTEEMFAGCPNLTSLDLSGFITKNVITMRSMFEECTSLQSITFGESFDTSNVCDMEGMFASCPALESLNLKTFNTKNVVNFAGMFLGCSSLQTIFNMNFRTKNAVNFYQMFCECNSLLFLDVSSFDLSNATEIGGIFDFYSENLKYFCTPRFLDYSTCYNELCVDSSIGSFHSANGNSLRDLSESEALSYSEAYVADASELETIYISNVTVDGSKDSCFDDITTGTAGSFYVYNGLFNKYMFPLDYSIDEENSFEDYDFTYGDEFNVKLEAGDFEFAWFEFGIVTGAMGYYSSADGLEGLYIHVLNDSGVFEMNYSNPGVTVDVVLILNQYDSNLEPYGDYYAYYQNLTWGISANDSFGDAVGISDSNAILRTFTNFTFEKLLYCLPSYPFLDDSMVFKCWRIGFPGNAEGDSFYENNWVLSWDNLENLPDVDTVRSQMDDLTRYSNTIFIYPEFISRETALANASASSDATNTATNTNGGGGDVMNGLSSLDLNLYGNEKCILPDNKKTTGVVFEEEKVA